MEEVGRKELLRDVGGAQGGEKVGRRVSTAQDSNADNSDQYRPGTQGSLFVLLPLQPQQLKIRLFPYRQLKIRFFQ